MGTCRTSLIATRVPMDGMASPRSAMLSIDGDTPIAFPTWARVS